MSNAQYVFWKDQTLNYIGCNQAFADFVGIASPQQIQGKTDFDLSWTHRSAQQYRHEDKQLLDTQQPQLQQPIELLDAKGKILHCTRSQNYLLLMNINKPLVC